MLKQFLIKFNFVSERFFKCKNKLYEISLRSNFDVLFLAFYITFKLFEPNLNCLKITFEVLYFFNFK